MSTRIHKPQNAALVALAMQCGSMRALAEAMGIHWTTLYAWARGAEIPDFARMLAKGRYGQANDCILRLTGKTLVEFFGQESGDSEAERVCFTLPASWRQCDDLDFAFDLRKLLQGLSARQLLVLLARMQGDSLEAVGAELGITREWVRQIEMKAKIKLRFYCRRAESRPLGRDSLCPSGATLVSTMAAPSGDSE